MDDKLKNPFVFPQLDEFPSGKVGVISGGITLRDYFAAKAMQGILSNEIESQGFIPNKDTDTDGVIDYDLLSNHSYIVADAMLKARNE